MLANAISSTANCVIFGPPIRPTSGLWGIAIYSAHRSAHTRSLAPPSLPFAKKILHAIVVLRSNGLLQR